MSKKRTLDQFFQTSPASRKTARIGEPDHPRAPAALHQEVSDNTALAQALAASKAEVTSPVTTSFSSAFSIPDPSFSVPSDLPPSTHETYPFAIPLLPDALSSALETSTPASDGRIMDESAAPHLDLVSYVPFFERSASAALFRFLRGNLPYYRVKYSIRRGASEIDINTPRWTTVWGVDDTAKFVPPSEVVEGPAATKNGVKKEGAGSDAGKETEAKTAEAPVSTIKPDPDTEPNLNGSNPNSNPNSNSGTDTASTTTTTTAASASPPTELVLVDAKTRRRIPASQYPTCRPRPVPECLDVVRRLVEAFTGQAYNFVLVNYYADGADSISWHSDDERFLGREPAIASLSLGSTRDFLLRHKPLARDARADHTPGIAGNRGTYGVGGRGGRGGGGSGGGSGGGGGGGVVGKEDIPLTDEEARVREAHKNPLKFPMVGGDMILMRGQTQSHWLHSVPKRGARSAGGGEGGRINITFRRALTKGGTENYYQYNVGRGPAMTWDEKEKTFKEWVPKAKAMENADRVGPDTDVHLGNAPTEYDNDEGWTRQSSKYGLKFERKFRDT